MFQISSDAKRPLAPRFADRFSFSLFFYGDEPFEILEPVLDQYHFGDRRRLPVFELDHEKSLPVEGQVIGAYRVSAIESGFLKQEARLAGREAAVCPDIHDPHLILPSIEKLFAVSCPKRLAAPIDRYLLLHAWTGERLDINFLAI